MRDTVKEWKEEWLQTNGRTNDLEVLISDNFNNRYIYEGSFANIPKELEESKVVKWWKVAYSSIPARIGAYSLMI